MAEQSDKINSLEHKPRQSLLHISLTVIVGKILTLNSRCQVTCFIFLSFHHQYPTTYVGYCYMTVMLNPSLSAPPFLSFSCLSVFVFPSASASASASAGVVNSFIRGGQPPESDAHPSF